MRQPPRPYTTAYKPRTTTTATTILSKIVKPLNVGSDQPCKGRIAKANSSHIS